MPTTDPRVDAVIQRMSPPVQAMLVELRKRVHAAVPQVAETIKWKMPFFMHEGRILAMMAGFRQHARYGLWVVGVAPPESNIHAYASLAELPPARAMKKALQEAAARLERGEASSIMGRRARADRPVVKPPLAFTRALAANARAKAAWPKLTPSVRRDYVEWVAGARQDATKARRITQALALIAAGKGRLWRYEKQ